MKSHNQHIARSVRVSAIALFTLASAIAWQPSLAGGNVSGGPSGATVAGSSTVSPVAVGVLTNLLRSSQLSIVTTAGVNSAGGATTTKSVTLGASSGVARSLGGVGLTIPPVGSSQTYVGPSGVIITVTSNNNGSVTFSSTTNN